MKFPISNLPIANFPRCCGPENSKFEIGNWKCRAFTLIEIMVVVAIIGLVAAMGVPSMVKALQKEGMRKAVSDVQDVCFNARQQAIFSKQKISVVFLPQRRPVQRGRRGRRITRIRQGHVGDAARRHQFRDAGHFPAGLRRNRSGRAIFFYPDGTCDEAVIVLAGQRRAGKNHLGLCDRHAGRFRRGQMKLFNRRRQGLSRRPSSRSARNGAKRSRAFSLLEVMIAIATFFLAVFAILGLVSQIARQCAAVAAPAGGRQPGAGRLRRDQHPGGRHLFGQPRRPCSAAPIATTAGRRH